MAMSANQTEYLAVHLSHAGLLPSHVYFGSCFFVLGAWWFVAILRSHFRPHKLPQSALTFSGKCGPCSGQLLEGLVKLVACVVGLLVEQITVSRLGRPANYTYTSIYASFLLASIVDIFIGLRVVLPEGIDFIAHAVAFGNLATLARSHARGHLHLTVATRMLTSYVATCEAIFLILELYKPQSLILKYMRAGAVMLQGVWFWQAGLVLDSPFAGRWEETAHVNLMFITIAFAWLMCGVFLFQVFFAVAMGKLFGGGAAAGREPSRFRRGGVKGPERDVLRGATEDAVDDYKPLQTSDVLEVDANSGTL